MFSFQKILNVEIFLSKLHFLYVPVKMTTSPDLNLQKTRLDFLNSIAQGFRPEQYFFPLGISLCLTCLYFLEAAII